MPQVRVFDEARLETTLSFPLHVPDDPLTIGYYREASRVHLFSPGQACVFLSRS